MDERHLLPAPFPPYALLAFVPISKLPFRLATECWLAVNIIALGFAVVGLSRLSGLRPTIVAIAVLASVGYASLVIGQLVPIVITALIYLAICARSGDALGAVLAVCVASIEPHLALPAWFALALFVPRFRVPLSLAAALLIVISFFAGPALNAEYVTQVLPQHARSELYNFAAQYSLSSLLAAAGVPANVALFFGSLSYAIALAFGLWLGRLLQKQYHDPAYAILAPVAAVLLGGPFVHAHQMAAAMPFGLLLLGRLPRRSSLRLIAFSAIFALAIPWESIAEMSTSNRIPPNVASSQVVPTLPSVSADEPIERPYTAFIDVFAQRVERRTVLEQLLTKCPTWYGLIALLLIAVRSHSRISRSAPPRLSSLRGFGSAP